MTAKSVIIGGLAFGLLTLGAIAEHVNDQPHVDANETNMAADDNFEVQHTDGATRGKHGLYLPHTKNMWLFGLGIFDVRRNDKAAALVAEYHWAKNWGGVLNPFVGGMLNHKGGGHVFAGLALGLRFHRRIMLTISFAPGLYWKGGGKDLGHVIEFRSQAELAYLINDDGRRIGIAINHMSNASISSKNPGQEMVVLNYTHPIG